MSFDNDAIQHEATSPATPAWDDRPWARWAMSLVEPLIPSRYVENYLDQMVTQARHHPVLAKTVLLGVLEDVLDSLPRDDPWRQEGFVSGTWHDGVDLTGAVEIPAEDVHLCGLAIPLNVPAHNLFSAAVVGRAQLEEVWEKYRDVRSLTEAIMWVTWRRRMLAGMDDIYVLVSFHSWLNRVRGGVVLYDEAELSRQREDARLVLNNPTPEEEEPF